MSWYHAFEIGARYLEILVWPVLVGLVLWQFSDETRYILTERDWKFGLPGGGEISAQHQPPPDEEDVEEASEIAEEGEAPEDEEIDVAEADVPPERRIQALRLSLFFERTVQWIFGSQLGLLFELAEQEGGRAGTAPIAKWYTRYRKAVGRDSAMPQESWLRYLTHRNLIEVEYGIIEPEPGLPLTDDEDEVEVLTGASLTALGNAFVLYCHHHDYTSDKFPS